MVLLLDWKMSLESSVFIGFVDGANHHTRNLASTTWVIYSPLGQVVTSGGAFLGPTTNNVVEYSIMIELLRDVISHGILSLEVHLDSQLVVSQLNGEYHVCDPTLLRRFLWVCLLECYFTMLCMFMFLGVKIQYLMHMLIMF
jgi:hypothetical protein